jgi:hypothetical protein
VRRLVVIVLAALAFAPAATAGGDFVDLAVSGGTAWFVGPFGIRSIAGGSGVATGVAASASAYPLSVAVGGGAVWVASVANGFVDGKLTRIDPAGGRARVVLRQPAGSVQAVTVGAGGVYVLVGRAVGNQVVRVTFAGRVAARWTIVDAGRIAADASGCWVSADHRLIHIRPNGRKVTVLNTVDLGDVATGDGAVWLAQTASITRVDERTGVVRTVRTARLRPGGFQHDLAVGVGALWTLDTSAPSLQRRSAATGRVERSVALPGIPDAVVPAGGAVWVGVAVTHQVLRFDPRTLRRTLAVTVS